MFPSKRDSFSTTQQDNIIGLRIEHADTQDAGNEHDNIIGLRIEHAGKEYDNKMLARKVMHPSLMNCEKVKTEITDSETEQAVLNDKKKHDKTQIARKVNSSLKNGEKLQTGEMFYEKGQKAEKCLNNMPIKNNGKEQIEEHGKKEQIEERSDNKTIGSKSEEDVNILWFRNGIRLHDNGSLHNATQNTKVKYVLVNLLKIMFLSNQIRFEIVGFQRSFLYIKFRKILHGKILNYFIII